MRVHERLLCRFVARECFPPSAFWCNCHNYAHTWISVWFDGGAKSTGMQALPIRTLGLRNNYLLGSKHTRTRALKVNIHVRIVSEIVLIECRHCDLQCRVCRDWWVGCYPVELV